MIQLRLAGVIRESIVDGPGIRFVVFAQGCPHQCIGCHNPQSWPFDGGFIAQPGQIIEEMLKNPLVKGLTISGGEPFCQSAAMAQLAQAARQNGFDVITYTGFTFEKLLEQVKTDPAVLELLCYTDILIDGPFIQDLKSYELRFKGSSNQRMIDVKPSLEQGKAVLIQL
ncbi:anaerobic ribonucleoside-triphosphate reductase activating protein [Anaerospora hongkongensis]|uniref:Anaerobic ribonucleoside-triphosphate reductase-activating protein n=1 Tax=Anaerospora hongkongensis TaxID=244830 RepID=A0A4R1QAV8_9FIRM|nr:anaerobic ribonucleoside-triphosphate reductase activating protein [Anaerospora hongkongensis]TCL39312.1 anaerobic ribonucleoside-triphosphate reductase activating protein [Anaerospora hongkongensis]